MNLFKLLLILVVAYGAYKVYHHKQQKRLEVAMAASASSNGFVPLPAPTGASPDVVLILRPDNCPKEGAQRAEALANALKNRDIPFRLASNVNFSFPGGAPDAALITQLNTVMKGEIPVVFVRGRGKANPTPDEVVAEYSGNS